MNISQISFGSKRKYNNEYNYAEYYNLNNINNFNVQETKKETFAPEKINTNNNDNFIKENFQEYSKTNKTDKKKTGTIIGTVCGFILTSILGVGVATNTQQVQTNNTPKNNYSATESLLTSTTTKNYYTTQPTTQPITTSTKDYIINDTKQGKTADCWLLATINSLNGSKIGKEFFKNLFEYKENETIVHLHVGDYTITNEELETGRKRNSKGDDDVLLIELAVEKALADYNDGKVILPQAVITDELGGKGTSSTLNMGSQDAAIYILTGNSAEYLKINKYENKIDEYFKLFQTNKKENMSLTASIEGDSTSYTNLDNEKYFLKGHHAYCIKEIKDDYIIITNPDNSSYEIKMDIESFKDIFSSVTVADISNIA